MRGLSTRLVIAISLLAALHLAVFVTLLVALGSVRGADDDARAVARVTLAASGLQVALVKLEAAERGVAIAGADAEVLAAWRRSATELRERLDGFAREAQPRDRPVIGQIRRYLTDFSTPLVATARRDPAAARRLVTQGTRERRIQAMDERLTKLLERDRAARQQRRDRATGQARTAQLVGVAGLFATVLCALGFLAYIRRAILVPLRGVADAARALAAGDLRTRVASNGGVGEVHELARTFDQMAASLEESRAALESQNTELAAQSAGLAAAADSARAAERVKDDFFALVSHELRTPLTAIVGYVELVLGEDGATLPEEHAHNLAIVDRNAQRLLRLVGDLLFAAQVESGALLMEPDTVDLPQLVRDAVELARPRAEDADIALTVEVEQLDPCLGDRDRLAQVLDNLVSNALKFTLPGGRISVRLTARDASARIQVQDTGVGIPPDDLPRLFERFYRARNATAAAVPGLGLGLMIAQAIVTGHGGRIEIQSEVGVGTTFTVMLPLRPIPASPRRTAAGYPAGGR